MELLQRRNDIVLLGHGEARGHILFSWHLFESLQDIYADLCHMKYLHDNDNLIEYIAFIFCLGNDAIYRTSLLFLHSSSKSLCHVVIASNTKEQAVMARLSPDSSSDGYRIRQMFLCEHFMAKG